jgi:tRNA dimethylallyltransferase
MWADGLVEEVRALADRGLREGVTASRAIGYSQVLAFLDGDLTAAQAREQIVNRTRRFVRRQDGWFRKDQRITWVDHDDPERLEKAITAIRRL